MTETREPIHPLRQRDLLPVPYYHIVFTLPAAIADVAFMNKATVYGALFKAVSQTLLTIGADSKHLGAKLGATLVLHTWGSAMMHHPHIHGIVPGGGLSPDGSKWVDCRANVFLPVRVLSALFRRLMCERLAKLHADGALKFFGHNKHLAETGVFAKLLQRERCRDGVVYAKRPFAGPDQVLAYLARYTHRIAISNSRITAFDGSRVTFRVKDNRKQGKARYTTMTRALSSILHTTSKRIVTTARNDTARPIFKKPDESTQETAAEAWPGHQNPASMHTDTQNQAQNHSDHPPAQTSPGPQSP